MPRRAQSSFAVLLLVATSLLLVTSVPAFAITPSVVHDDAGVSLTVAPRATTATCILEPGPVDDVGCVKPDLSRTLCPEVGYPVATNEKNENYEFYTLAIEPGCCIAEDAFVLLRFGGLENCSSASGNTSGITASLDGCVDCDEFVTVQGLFPTPTTWCEMAENSLWVQLDADCCGATPTSPRSWGHVKSIYR